MVRPTDRFLSLLPSFVREQLIRHREGVKFLIVGGFCYLITLVLNYALRLTVLEDRKVTALTIATTVATFVSYLLNREWSFRTRGGRRRHHEMLLYTVINVLAVGINSVPLFLALHVFDLREPHLTALQAELSDFAFGMVLGTLLAMGFRLWAYRAWVFPTDDVRPAPVRHHDRIAPREPLEPAAVTADES